MFARQPRGRPAAKFGPIHVQACAHLLLSAWLTGLGWLAPTATPSWHSWQHLPGVFDLAGPRGDGRLVAAAGGMLFLLSPDGTVTPFAEGPGGYQVTSGPEAYLDVSSGLRVAGAGCEFAPDDVFVLRPTAPLGITRVDAQGHASNFKDIRDVDSLNGIVFDRVGRFDHRLLVSAPHGRHTTIFALDCKGGTVVITDSAPPLEGGLTVAPSAFGGHGGELIGPDENSGAVWTISATGHFELLAESGIARGGDIGVESAGFVPAGFVSGGGFAYVADRGTPNNPHPGTDSILRMSSTDLQRAGVRDGDLLIVAEGGAVTVDVRCSGTCRATTIVPDATSAHPEGHLVFLATQSGPSPPSLSVVSDLGSKRAQLLFRLAAGALLVAVVLVLLALTVRRTRRR